MADRLNLARELRSKDVANKSSQTTRNGPTNGHKIPAQTSEKAVAKKPQQDDDLVRNRVSSPRNYGAKPLPNRPSPSIPERKGSKIEERTTSPRAVQKEVPRQQPGPQIRKSTRQDSIHSAESQGRTGTPHRKQPSADKIDQLSRPKHITPKKTNAKTSELQTNRAPRPVDQRAVAKQKGIELPFKDPWSNSKVEREQTRRPPVMQVEQFREPTLELSGLTSFFGLDSRRQHEMEMLMHTVRSLEKRLESTQRANEELKYNLADLSRKNDGLVDDLRKIQQKSFNQMTKSAWTPLEDRAIQDVLDEIHRDIEAWAEENCFESFEEVKERLNETQQATLFEKCKSVSDINQDDIDTQFNWWEERDVPPFLLFTALAIFHLYSCVFNNEFLILEGVEEGSMGVMVEVYRKLADIDSKEAHVWRSQLMRIIVGTPRSAGRFDGIQSKFNVPGFIKHYCAELLGEFDQHPETAFLKSELTTESREALLGCWTRAAELFVQLQTQVAKVQWSATDRIRSTVNPRFVESHRSQILPKGRNDGKPISLVISPMVVFFGNEDGEKYEDWRTVCKATVLVIDEEIEETEEESEVEGTESDSEKTEEDDGDDDDDDDDEEEEEEEEEEQL